MKFIALLGRILFSLIFLMTVASHFKPEAAQYAASKGVLLASILVPLAGVIAIAGALNIILGYKAKLGAWMIVIFLIPVTLMMHAFWKETDPVQVQMQTSNFLKNVSMLGSALIIAYFGSGPLSIDNRKTKFKAEKIIYNAKIKKRSANIEELVRESVYNSALINTDVL